MWKFLRNVLAYWVGLSIVFTLLSLWMSGFVIVHYVLGIALLAAVGFALADQLWKQKKRDPNRS